MKFILPLLSTTTVFGSILGSKFSAEGLLESVKSYNGSENCISEITKIQNCIMNNITNDKLEESCSNYNSEACQALYEDPMKVLPSCKENAIISALANSSINLIALDLKVKCQKDENGKDCPLAEVELTNSDATNEVISEAIKNSCKSKTCRENALNFLEYTSETNDKASGLLQDSITTLAGAGSISEESLNAIVERQSINDSEIKKYIETLKGENCVAQSVANVITNDASDAFKTIRSLSSIICTIVFLVLYNRIF